MVIKAELIRKQTGFPVKACRVDKVVTLSPAEFAEFTSAPKEYYDFIKDFNNGNPAPEDGALSCILVLGEHEEDGILIDPQGMITQGIQHTSRMPGRWQCLNNIHRLPVPRRNWCSLRIPMSRKRLTGSWMASTRSYWMRCRKAIWRLLSGRLFMDMLAERPEFSWTDTNGNGIIVGIAPEYIRQENDEALKRLSQKEADILCAKHLLWLHEAGGSRRIFRAAS